MRKTKIDIFIADYCQQHGITLTVDPQLGKDDGLCYPTLNEIHISRKYSSPKIKIAIVLHEIGHIKVEHNKEKPYNIFECELMAWNHAIYLHKKYFNKSFSKTQAEYMLKCLRGYCRSQYEFKKISISSKNKVLKK